MKRATMVAATVAQGVQSAPMHRWTKQKLHPRPTPTATGCQGQTG